MALDDRGVDDRGDRRVDDHGVDDYDHELTKSGLWVNYCIFNSYKNHEIPADIYEIYK